MPAETSASTSLTASAACGLATVSFSRTAIEAFSISFSM
jgi:hypothetical protein